MIGVYDNSSHCAFHTPLSAKNAQEQIETKISRKALDIADLRKYIILRFSLNKPDGQREL
jgi:hypothetical protein